MKFFHHCTLVWMLILSSAPVQAQAKGGHVDWTGSWAAAPSRLLQPADVGVGPETIREIMHLSMGGQAIRVRLSNAFGTEPLTIERASFAFRADGDTLKTKPVLLTFQGSQRVVIPAGSSIVTDELPIEVPALGDIAISVFVPSQPINVETVHLVAFTTKLHGSR